MAVLVQSQQWRLAQRPAAEARSERAAKVLASFERLLSLQPAGGPTELVLVGGDLYAEALFGRRAVAVSESVGDLGEGERLMLLAHELGHLALGHWGALSALYRQHIPGDVTPEATTPVAAALGAQAHALSHKQEFEADAFGYTLVHPLGFGVDTAMALLLRHGVQMDSATHPGTRRRVAQLRVLDAQIGHEALHGGPAQAVAGGAAAMAVNAR
ncbi:MAG: hypothetical protein CFE45_15435 [Burkholderiales bacterium PBB5]|nr:MAG: hypothetical protein CFE45_15435 [Burkholderiales bacterium PBB5]